MIETRQLRALVAVADEAHFGRAAERLGQSQPSLSRAIQTLEQAVGTPLLRRTTRRVEPTAAGAAFLARARVLLAGLDAAVDDAKRAAAGLSGRLVVAYMDFAILGVLPRLVAAFRRDHPDVEVDLRYSWTARQRAELLAGEVDLGFLIGPFTADGVRTRTVDRQCYVAVLPDAHPLASRRHVRLADLAHDPFVFGVAQEWGPLRDAVNRLCNDAGFSPRVVQEAHSRDGIFGFVAAGLGVTLYTDVAFNVPRRGVTVLPLVGVREQVQVIAAWRSVSAAPALRRFLACLDDAGHL